MSGNGKAGNGRGNNRRHQFRRRNNEGEEGYNNSFGANPFRMPQKPQEKKGRGKWPDENQNRGNFGKNTDNVKNDRPPAAERPKWIPPKLNTYSMPAPDCPYCGKPIRDISQAISDRDTGVPVHFDCVTSRIAGTETLEKDDSVTYIGGGRFGIVSFSGRTEFRIKKIIEWENRDKRAEWRSEICENFTIT